MVRAFGGAGRREVFATGQAQMIRPEEADAGVGEVWSLAQTQYQWTSQCDRPVCGPRYPAGSCGLSSSNTIPCPQRSGWGPVWRSAGATLEPFVVVEDIRDPAVTAKFPDDPYDLVVLMGSPWSVYEDRVQGWLAPELDFIRSRLATGVPMLGICFGAQAMSAALGGWSATRPDRSTDGPASARTRSTLPKARGSNSITTSSPCLAVPSNWPETSPASSRFEPAGACGPVPSRDDIRPARLLVSGGRRGRGTDLRR